MGNYTAAKEVFLQVSCGGGNGRATVSGWHPLLPTACPPRLPQSPAGHSDLPAPSRLPRRTRCRHHHLQVQEASAASDGFWRMPDAWVNLANVYLAQQQYIPAIQMYKTALRKFYDNRSAIVMLYLARWVGGRAGQ